VTVSEQAVPAQTLQQRLAGRWKRDLVFFLIAGFIIALDQFTKWLVRSNLALYEAWPDHDSFIRIIHVVNSGAAFGILQGQTLFLIVTSSLGLGAILLYYVYPPMEHGIIRVALGMQLGGAIGNLIDRVRMGEVTDFVDVGQFPTFNVADASISTSIAAVLIFFVLQEAGEGKPRPDARPPDARTNDGRPQAEPGAPAHDD
jgi:signal peptidase II